MLIGNTIIDYEVLKSFVGKPDELVTYVTNSVPSWARHIECLVNNQRFYVAIHLRNVLTLPYHARMELVNALVEGIHIQGIISSFTSITDLVNACDKQALHAMLKERLAENERC